MFKFKKPNGKVLLSPALINLSFIPYERGIK